MYLGIFDTKNKSFCLNICSFNQQLRKFYHIYIETVPCPCLSWTCYWNQIITTIKFKKKTWFYMQFILKNNSDQILFACLGIFTYTLIWYIYKTKFMMWFFFILDIFRYAHYMNKDLFTFLLQDTNYILNIMNNFEYNTHLTLVIWIYF